MAFEEERQQQSSLKQIKKVCKIAYYFVSVIYFSILVGCLLILAVCCVELVLPGALSFVQKVEGSAVLAAAIDFAITILILRFGAMLLREIVKGEYPFSLKQAKRIRVMSYLLFVRIIIDIVFPATYLPIIDEAGITATYTPMSIDTLTLNINPETVIFAILLFCISLVFQYGVLLQKDSNDFF